MRPGQGRRNFPYPKSLILSQEGVLQDPRGRSALSHLPDVVQELGGGQAVLWAGELAAVVLEEGQQVRLQVKQPVGGGPGVSPYRPPLAPRALAAQQWRQEGVGWCRDSAET